MIEPGKWKFTVNTRFYSGIAYLIVGEKDGAYEVSAELANGKKPDFRFSQLKAEGGTLVGVAQHSLLQGSLIPFTATFANGSASGSLDVPFLGMISFRGAEKVE
ncbi:MAG: hypothetical protein FWE98_02510 [Oscillospiraceae bacterium]|nr:hypothetical protein [Oscillospiraceae bacterium]